MKTSFLVETHPHDAGHRVRALLRIEGEVPPDDARAPLNLAFVLDRSGSMGGGKLEAVKRAARDLILRLHPDDRVSVVAFDDEVHTVARAGSADEQVGLIRSLMALDTGGCTNLSGGWLQGRALVHEQLAPDGVHRVILLTDGLANRGVTDPAVLRRLCGEALEARVSTTTVGVGADYDETLLGDLAEAGGGATYYIERLDQTAGIFEEELEGLLTLAAQNLTVRIRAREAVSLAAVHHTYPSAVGPDDTLILTLGDLYAREPSEVLADFLVEPEQDAPDGAPVPVADIVVEGDVWTGSGGFERRVVTLPITFDPSQGAVSHPEVTKVYTLLEAARARRDAVKRGDAGDIEGAAGALHEAVAMMAACPVDDPKLAREIADLEQMEHTLREQRAMTEMDRKYLYTKERAYSRGRRNQGDRLER
ncbi:MAG: VWA domain-containing protein [Longimicrobiales bacterium]